MTLSRADDLPRGALFALTAASAFALMSVCVKAASQGLPNEMIVFFRSTVSLLCLLPWLLRQGWPAIRTTQPWGHLWRSAFGTCSIYAFFYAIGHLHLAEALVLTYSTPLFIPFMAWLFIDEPPAPVVLFAAGLGMLGIFLIAKPSGADLKLATFIGVGSSITASAAMVTIRRISHTEPATRIVFWFSAFSAAVSCIPLAWAWREPSFSQLMLMIATGVFAVIGQLCLTRAYSLAPASRIGVFTYAAVVFGGLFGWLLWDERPDASSIAGMLLVVACCLLASWRGPSSPTSKPAPA